MTGAVPLDDRGLLLGDGLFETLLAREGRLRDLEAHLDRMDRGCAALGLPALDRREAEAAMARAVEGVGGLAAVRLTLTAGSGGRGLDRPANVTPRIFASASPYAPQEGSARLVTASVRRNEASPASRLKTLAYLDNVLARREAAAARADEALMLNTRGEVACAAAANLFWIAQDRLFTPALACGVLDGTMRTKVLTAATGLGVEIAEVQVGAEVLAQAEGLFLTNSLMGVREVGELDGRRLPALPLAATLARRVEN
ncbi:MAG: aminotransferase class IV [Phenylobacterium sp.]|uniref:aminotransferase class IV n=1 Tax=Phenylobacterium sp. TaxID=1871053 RepID=UPI00391B248A